MTPSERAETLHHEATRLLEFLRLAEHCAGIGELTPSGSYFLNLMMYPDIDLYLPPTSPQHLLGVGVKLAANNAVTEVNFKKSGPEEASDLAGGLYLKPRIALGNWERPWKIDIWALPKPVIQKKQAQLEDLASRMTPEQRQRILQYKFSVLTPAGRTPMFSGIHIYRAVIDLGLVQTEAITAYLREQGIDL